MKKTLLSIGAITLFASTTFAQIPTDSLESYWPFNMNSLDESGNGHDGTANGDASLTTDRFGNTNRAYHFDGDGDYISTTSNFTLGDSAKSLSIWMKPDTLNRGWMISGGSNTNGKAFGLFMNSSANPGVYFHGNSASFDLEIINSTLMSAGAWNHIVISYDGTEMIGYLNGASSANAVFILNTDLAFLNGGILLGGRQGLTLNDFFEGALDDIRIYKRALTSSEVTDLYNEADPTLGVESLELLTLKVYPNPAANSLTVEVSEDITVIEIYSMTGELKKTATAPTFSVEELSRGVYFINVLTTSGVLRTRFVKN